MTPDLTQPAALSDDGVYRYWLRRELVPGESHDHGVVFCMLNPSVADATRNDPTLRKCMGFASRLHATWVGVVNPFAFRTRDPKVLLAAAARGQDVVGPDNDLWIAAAAAAADVVVLAWGATGLRGHLAPRIAATEQLVRGAGGLCTCLGRTAGGAPFHPLMLPYNTALEPWAPGGF